MTETFRSIDPATGAEVTTMAAATPAEVAAAVEAAHAAHMAWRRVPCAGRAGPLRAAAAALRARRDELARLMAREMGKPLAQGRAEADKCAWACEHYAEHGEELLADEPVATEASRSYVHHEPLGVVLAIMPWNFPFWQVVRCAAPALMAGNAVLLKHAPSVPGCAEAIAWLLQEAGLPGGLFANLRLPVARLDEALAHPAVRAVALTGSVAAGRAVASRAGALLKPCVLELGGSDPYVILADADLDQAAEVCAASRLSNSGQSCIAAKRCIVPAAVREPFERRLVAAMAEARVGPPGDEGVDVGPLARHDLRDALADQVARSLAAGARCLLGGAAPDGPGAFYPPTVLTDVRAGMPAFDEELFGPVAAVVPVRDEEAALAAANATAYGLGAAVFTRDPARGEALAAGRLQAGCCFVNAAVRSDPRLPFGGIKDSGFGRELGRAGIRAFVNVKTVWIA